MEEWKQYRDTNYEVSNKGEIRNKESGKKISQQKKYNGKVKNDYMRVSIRINGKQVCRAVHRMVAECFLEDYSDELEVNHKNSIRNDNRIENLEMTTKEENYVHSIEHGGGSPRRAVYCLDDNGNKKEFKSLWSAARWLKEVKKLKSSIDTICTGIKYSINGRYKKAYGYEWYDL